MDNKDDFEAHVPFILFPVSFYHGVFGVRDTGFGVQFRASRELLLASGPIIVQPLSYGRNQTVSQMRFDQTHH